MLIKIQRILAITIVAILVAGFVNASLGTYWKTVDDIVPRTDSSRSIGSSTKEVLKIWTESLSSANEIGIGDSTPQAALEIATSGTSFMISATTGGDGDIFIVDSSGNVGIGDSTPNNTIQVADLINFDNTGENTYLGYQTGAGAGTENVGVGFQVLTSNTSGEFNTGIGYLSLTNNTEGSFNMAMGGNALAENTTGDENVAMGAGSLSANISGGQNVAIGNEAGAAITTESGNVFIGDRAGQSATGANQLFISNSDRTLNQSLIYGVFSDTTANQTLTFNASVGIGDASPDRKLEVLDTATQLLLTYDDGVDWAEFYVDGNGDLFIDTSSRKITMPDLYLSDFSNASESIDEILDDILHADVLDAITITDGGGLNITWSAGEIWDYGNSMVIDTDAEASAQACTDDNINYLYWDRSGGGTALTFSTTVPSESDGDVLVGTLNCASGDIWEINEKPIYSKEIPALIAAFRDIFPSIIASGLIVSEHSGDSAFDVDMTAGVYYVAAYGKETIDSKDSTTDKLTTWYKDGASSWTATTGQSEIDETQWNNGTSLEAVGTPSWYKSLFFVTDDGINWVYPTAEYLTKAQAIAAPDPELPAGLTDHPKSTALILQWSATALPTAAGDQWIDRRPIIGGEISGDFSDHGSLAGLGDDDHTIYLLEDGTRALSGEWSLGNQNLTNGGTAAFTTLNTGQGAYELYAMNQDVESTDDVTFDILTVTTLQVGAEYALPSEDGENGQVIQTDGNGNMSWVSIAGGHDAVTLTGQDYLTLSGQEITMGEIEPDDLGASDFGDFSCDGTNCAFDTDTIAVAEFLASQDWGDVSTDGDGLVTLDAGVVDTTAIANDTILEANLNVDEVVADNDILTFDTTGGNFSWQTPAELITAGNAIAWDSTTLNVTLRTQAEVEDWAGGLFTGNTETLIAATYQEADNTLDLVVDSDLHKYSWTNVVDADITDTLSANAIAITDGLIVEADLNADEEPADNDILTFDTTGSNFSWQTPTELSLLYSGGTLTDTQLCVADGTTGGIDCNIAQTYYVQDGCTDCLNATEIEDIYLLDTTDTLTGILTVTTLQIGTEFAIPGEDGTNGQVMATDGSGNLYWTSVAGGHNEVTLAGQDYLTLSTQEITAGEIEPDDLAASDFGEFTCDGSVCTIDDSISVSSWTIASPTFTTGITATDLIDSAHYVADSIDNEHINWADITNLGDEGSVTLAATATALATARNIGGVSFDGTAAIVPTTIVVADTEDATTFVGLWDSATGSLLPKTDEQLTYVANTGVLTAVGFAGPLTGAVTGNASTATALFANGGNCAAGSYPLGVDASGAIEDCTDATTEINTVVNALGGTNLTCAAQTCNVDDAFITDGASDVMTGTLTADGLTLGANENITLGSNTLDHDGTDFVFNDTLTITGDSGGADDPSVPMMLYNTDDTPPAASTYPIGTIYIQYTP